MGKADIYVFLILVAVALVVVAGWGIYRVCQQWEVEHRRKRIAELDAATGWTHYCRVGRDGGYSIGVERVAYYGDERRVFNLPIQICELPADHDPLDVELRVNVARDRASVYNASRAGQ
jgi:hypothetical protein